MTQGHPKEASTCCCRSGKSGRETGHGHLPGAEATCDHVAKDGTCSGTKSCEPSWSEAKPPITMSCAARVTRKRQGQQAEGAKEKQPPGFDKALSELPFT